MKLPVISFAIVSSAALVFGAGCLNIGEGDVQPTLYYNLEPVEVPPVALSSEMEHMIVGLDRIDVPDYLNRREIVVRTGRNEMRYTERHLWAERPSDSLQRLLALNIERQSSRPVEIHALPWPDHSSPNWVVYLDVLSFEGQESPETALLLEVSWTIQSTEDGSILKQGNYRGEHLSWSAGNYASLAGGLSKGLADLGRLIAKDLEEINDG
jgi:uncharacterized lipoprotein YmbA